MQKTRKRICRRLQTMWSPYPHPQVQLVNTEQVHTYTNAHIRHVALRHWSKLKLNGTLLCRPHRPALTLPLRGFSHHQSAAPRSPARWKCNQCVLLSSVTFDLTAFSICWEPFDCEFLFFCTSLLCFVMTMDFFMQRRRGWVYPFRWQLLPIREGSSLDFTIKSFKLNFSLRPQWVFLKFTSKVLNKIKP